MCIGVSFPESAFLPVPSLHSSDTFCTFHSAGAVFLVGRRESRVFFPGNKRNPVEDDQLFHYAISQYL